LAIGEARFFSEKLQDAGMHREGIIVNQVHSLIEEPVISVEDQVAELRDALPESIDAAHIHPRLSEALQAERGWAIADRAQVDRLGERVGGDTRIVEVPAFDQDVHDLAALARVASYLTVAV
jgi:hypothetical protein